MKINTKKRYEDRIHLPLSRIFVLTIMAIVVLTSIVALLFYMNSYTDTMEQNAITNSEQAVTQVSETLEEYTNDIAKTIETISYYMRQEPSEKSQFFRYLFKIKSDLVAVTTYDGKGNLIGCWSNNLNLKHPIYKNLSYFKIEKEKSGMQISKPHVQTMFQQSYPWVVTISEIMQDEQGRDIHVSIDIRFRMIADKVDNIGIGQHGYCFITDEDGSLIYHPQQQLLNAGLKSEKITKRQDGTYRKSDSIYSVKTLSLTNWKVVGVSYVDELITQKVAVMLRNLVMISLFVLLFSLLASNVFAGLFAQPVKKLVRAMSDFVKDPERYVHQDVEGASEIISLSNSFKQMSVQIQALMEQVRQEEIILKKTELNALQAQINPHFLYNTLDAIAWLCEVGRNEDAENMVNALARFFRISTSKGHEMITIEKEIEHAKCYLMIQQFRYKNQFQYTFEIDEECYPFLCNKITLQPIIENAIYHGIGRMADDGMITIRIYQEDGDIIFSVEDNGIGMDAEQCEEILKEDITKKSGIGIKNVNERIRIYFGEKYGIRIESELDEGTTVYIRMPKITEEVR
ncbi:MAG: sensor histidine kinase [Lachnospiraceae bacterium]